MSTQHLSFIKSLVLFIKQQVMVQALLNSGTMAGNVNIRNNAFC